jgi:predicted ATPase
MMQGVTLALSDRCRVQTLAPFGKFIDAWAACSSVLACLLWVRGYPEQALARIHETLTRHQGELVPVTRIYTLQFAGFVHQFCREVSVVHTLAQSLTALAHEQGFILYEASGRMQYG